MVQAILTGGPAEVQLERFREAFSGGVADLTIQLTGQRKQSVIDADRLLSPTALRVDER